MPKSTDEGASERFNGNNIGVYASPVPVPAALVLFISAMGGLGVIGLQRRTVDQDHRSSV